MNITSVFILVFVLISQTLSAQIHLGAGQPYADVQAAQVDIRPGDTVYLHAGSYAGYKGLSKLKGSAGKWITIQPYNSEVIEISGGWQFMSCEYIHLRGLTFRSTTKYPGRLLNVDNSGSCETQSRHIIIDSCSFSNTLDENAITTMKFGGVDSFVVRKCVFKDLPVCNAMDFNVCHHGVITENRIENCLSGGHIKGGGSDIVMERNLFLNASQPSWVAFELGGDTGTQFYCANDSTEVQDLVFRSNLIIGGYRGIALSSAVNCQIVNNTFYNCGQATLRLLTTSATFPRVSGNIIENNIFAFGTSAYINGSQQTADAASFSNNIYASITSATFGGAYWDTPALDAVKDTKGAVFGSGVPLFVSAAVNDFHLKMGSPAIAAGSKQHVPDVDFFGQPFSQSRPSIGAVEYSGPASEVELNIPSTGSVRTVSISYREGTLVVRGIAQQSAARVMIFNLHGDLVANLDDSNVSSTGSREFNTNLSLQTAVYFCILECKDTIVHAPLFVTH